MLVFLCTILAASINSKIPFDFKSGAIIQTSVSGIFFHIIQVIDTRLGERVACSFY